MRHGSLSPDSDGVKPARPAHPMSKSHSAAMARTGSGATSKASAAADWAEASAMSAVLVDGRDRREPDLSAHSRIEASTAVTTSEGP